MTAAMAEPLEPAALGSVESEVAESGRPQLNVLQGGLGQAAAEVAAEVADEITETAEVAEPVEQARTANGRPVPAPAPLEQYVAAAVAGDEVARDKLLQEIRPLVLRYCRARLGRQESVIGSAEDVAQDVCVAVLAALPGYTVKGLSFRAFVYGIAAHKVTDTFRAIGRNKSEPVADVPDTGVVLDGPEHQALMTELNTRLGGLLTVLTERQREVLVLRVVVGLSAEETAQTVGSTPGAVRVTQHRALARLRSLVTGGSAD